MTHPYGAHQPGGTPPPPPPPVYGYGYPPIPPQKPRSRRRFWIFVGVGVLLLVVLCCAGVIGLGFYGFNLIETEVRDLVRDDPVIVEHIGEIETFDVDFNASGDIKDDDTFVYQVKGTKGSGVLTVRHITDDKGDEVIQSAELRLPDGRVLKLNSP
jgi:hypothetical protein